MFDELVLLLEQYPYVGVAAVFVLCGLGLPLPEEVVLLAGGYVCAKMPLQAKLPWMMSWCAGAILVGDLIPFVLGRVFGARLLRLRWLRILASKQRLAMFDRWFRRRGDAVILVARFLVGLRVVAFFTAGTMKMPWRRFLVLDGLGIVLIVPMLTLLGYHSASFIDEVIANVQRVERGILWATVAGLVLVAAWLWIWRRRRLAQRHARLGETYVRPVHPPAEGATPAEPASAGATPVSADAAPPEPVPPAPASTPPPASTSTLPSPPTPPATPPTTTTPLTPPPQV